MQDLDRNIVQPFDLDPDVDLGLVTTAICFGLDPDSIINNWGLIKVVATQGTVPWSDISVEERGERLRQYSGAILVIAHLTSVLNSNGFDLSSLPPTILRWVTSAQEFFREGVPDVAPERIPVILEALRIWPGSEQRIRGEIYQRINPGTVKADYERMWPFIEQIMLEVYGIGPSRSRTWSTFERDVFIWRRHREDGQTYEAAYDEWLEINPQDKKVEITAIIKAVTKIDAL